MTKQNSASDVDATTDSIEVDPETGEVTEPEVELTALQKAQVEFAAKEKEGWSGFIPVDDFQAVAVLTDKEVTRLKSKDAISAFGRKGTYFVEGKWRLALVLASKGRTATHNEPIMSALSECYPKEDKKQVAFSCAKVLADNAEFRTLVGTEMGRLIREWHAKG